MYRMPLALSGILFLLISLIHLWRIIEPFPIVIGEFVWPEWLSIVAFVVLIVMAIWDFIALKGKCCDK